jgi:hypothetical protein
MGRDVYYLPREFANKDVIFGEDPISKFKGSYKIEMYVNSVGGFEGQGDIVSKFGIEIKDRVELVVSKKRFSNLISREDSDISRPKEGDLIYFPDSDTLFEINFVEHENPFYPLGKLYTYVLSCEAFTYSYETFDTGHTFIDDVSTDMSNTGFEVKFKNLTIGHHDTGYIIGETIYQIIGGDGSESIDDADGFGRVYDWTDLNDKNILLVGDESGKLDPTINEWLIGVSSGAKGKIGWVHKTDIVLPSSPITGTDLLDNVNIEKLDREDNIFDFTDIDPFSEGNY